MNKVTLLGRLTKDPDLRYTSGNSKAVASFTLAVNRRQPDKEGKAQADFIQIVAWDNVEGKRHYVTEVVAEETYFADSKKGPEQNETYYGDEYYPMD